MIEFIVDGLVTGLTETAVNTKSRLKRLLSSILLLCLFAVIVAFFVFVVITVAKKYIVLSIFLAVIFSVGIICYIASFIKTLRNKIKR